MSILGIVVADCAGDQYPLSNTSRALTVRFGAAGPEDICWHLAALGLAVAVVEPTGKNVCATCREAFVQSDNRIDLTTWVRKRA